MKKIVVLIALLVVSISCKEQKRIYLESNGRMNHLLLVIDNSDWNGEVGAKLKDIIKTPVLGMPQEEFQFDVSQVAETSFGKMFKASRNVLIIREDSVRSFQSQRNVYAKPQQMVKITGTDEADLIDMLEKNREKIINTFKDFDLQNVQESHIGNLYNDGHFKTLTNLGIAIKIPKMFRTVDDTGEFLWLRQHLSGGIAKGDGSSNILVYSIPMPEDKINLVSTISHMRDTIGKKYIPGRKENMFMITEKAITPVVKQILLDQKNAYATYGKWEVYNDFMAGPFLNYAIEDVKNNRWIVLEAFVYAPSVDKRDYMFEVEAVLKTIRF